MTYAPHALAVLTGKWTAPDAAAEVWAFGVRVRRTGTDGALHDPDAYIADVATIVGTWFANAANQISSLARLDTLKVNNIAPDGTYVDPVTHLHDYSGGIVGGAGQTMPGDMSLCLSWETDLSRGPASRGRVYPPNATVPLNPGNAFTVAPSVQTAYLASGTSLLSCFLQDSDGDSTLVQPIVASKIADAWQVITGVRVGRVWDVQRRRRNKITENYASVAFP